MNGDAQRETPNDGRALVAVDLGAESCRVSLLRWHQPGPKIQLVHRFNNGPTTAADGSLRWPLEQVVAGVEEGLRSCADLAPEGIRSVAVDGWAVDYVRLNEAGVVLEPPFCYRDLRTVEAERNLHSRIAPERLYQLTGVQLQRINTVYQLHADHLAGSRMGRLWLNLPEYLLTRLGAPPFAEYTNATHTGMVDLHTRQWSPEVLQAASIQPSTMPRLAHTGTRLGNLKGSLARHAAFRSTELIAPACHDTASAVCGIPAVDNEWAYISSGTWSLVGTPVRNPCIQPAARLDGFTNLGGVEGTICFHQGLNGLWLLRQCMNVWEAEAGWSSNMDELLAASTHIATPDHLLDVNDPELLLPGKMPTRINAQRNRCGLEPIEESAQNASAITSLILHSLASRYAQAIEKITQHTGKSLKRVFMVGGGSRNKFLCQLTEQKSKLPVERGSAESSTLGNLAVQLAALEDGADPDLGVSQVAVARWASRLSRNV